MKAALICTLSSAILVMGCSSTPPADAQAVPAQASPKSASAPASRPVVTNTVAETDAQRLTRLTRALEGKSVFFAYDDYTVAPDQIAKVQASADVLSSVPKAAVTLEGNTDERGSREYNLALGQKRADAVAKILKLRGIDPARLETVSLGEEKPREACHEEKCWATNRRVDFQFRLMK